jgi:hypothetical protein
MVSKKNRESKSKKASKKKISEKADGIAEPSLSTGKGNEGKADGEASAGTVTSSGSAKTRGTRGVVQMYKVLVKKSLKKKMKVSYNPRGSPCGSTRPPLQSYIGLLARRMVPINIESWPKVDNELKEKLWVDVQVWYFFYIQFVGRRSGMVRSGCFYIQFVGG